MKILIIGNGFIGDNLAYVLSGMDHHITIYARHKSIEYDHIHYIYGPIESIFNIANNFDHIFILYGYSRISAIKAFSDAVKVNYYLLTRILDFANKSKIHYIASSLVLSNDTCNSTEYAYLHSLAVNTIKQYNKWYRLSYNIMYLHNIYGNLTLKEKQHKMVVDNLLDAFKNKTVFSLINGGVQRRIFTHISDIMTYFIYSLNDQHICKEVNLVKNNKLYSVLELVETLGVSCNYLADSRYNISDPYTTTIDDLGMWSETIDIVDWLIEQKNKLI